MEKKSINTTSKKDQCSLCVNYQQGSEEVKRELQEKYTHVGEKEKVRERKNESKKKAMEDASILCATFDIQQVMYLPMSLAIVSFGMKHKANISTSVHTALKFHESKGFKKAYLFADDRSGQNKNSITPAMMLYTVNSTNLEISLRFFETNHGQSEGDSAHSAISHALNNAGDLFVPLQISPVVFLARPKQPYIVNRMQCDDCLDFKTLSKELRILEARRASDTEELFFLE